MPLFRRFITDTAGNTAMLFSLMLPAVVGVSGLGVETGLWYFQQRQLQAAADVAAIAGAVEKRSGNEEEEITDAALKEAQLHGFFGNAYEVNTPPQSGAHTDGLAVEVELTIPADRFFSKFFSDEQVYLSARGVAKYEVSGQACMLALDPEEDGALTFTGNAMTMINGCNIMSNSLSDSALIVNGSADVTVPCALAAGGVDVDIGLTLTQCSEPQSNVPPAADPFKNLPEPDVTGPCLSMPSGNGAATLTPGRYCGGGNLRGTKTFAPGVYVIDGGNFRINSNANISGTGVTIFLTNGATVDFNGTAKITLSAPTSGTYKGVLFYGDRDDEGLTSKFNGNAQSLLTGAIYLPSQELEFLGNFSGTNGCMRLVARTIKITGSSTMNADCSAYGLNDMPLPGKVTLVE
jgi:hypothetical protein